MHWSLEFATFRRRKLAPGKSYTQTLSFHFDGLSAISLNGDVPETRCHKREQWAFSINLTLNRSTFTWGVIRPGPHAGRRQDRFGGLKRKEPTPGLKSLSNQ
jgi:hypothetical protein